MALLRMAQTTQNRGMRRLALYPFRFRDRLTGKWVRARYKAEVPVIQRRYADWELTGAPEVRCVEGASAEPFNPFRTPPIR